LKRLFLANSPKIEILFFGLAESNYTQTQTKSHDYSLKANKILTMPQYKEIRRKCGCCGKYITKIQVEQFSHNAPTSARQLDERGILKKSDTDFYRVFQALIACGGGAWLNAKGEIIGIKTNKLDTSKGMNYHLPCAYKELAKRHDWGFGSYKYLNWTVIKATELLEIPYNSRDSSWCSYGIPTEQHLAAQKIQRWFRRDVRHKLSDPKHPAGFAVMIRGMEEVGMDEVEIAALKLEFKMKRQHKQVKDFFKSMEKSGKKVAKQVAKTK